MTVTTAFHLDSSWNENFHIGAARLALANDMFAEASNGKMVVYTNTRFGKDKFSTARFLDMLKWLGSRRQPSLYHFSHSEHLCKYQVNKLLALGCAYKDYSTQDELAKEEAAYREEFVSRPFFYSLKWAESNVKNNPAIEGRKTYVVRLKMPLKEEVVVHNDAVLGKVKFDFSRQRNTIIQNSDGSYSTALMRFVCYNFNDVTHIFDDAANINDIVPLLFISKRIGIEPPKFAHLHPILESRSNSRLSHRNLEKQLKSSAFSEAYSKCYRAATELGICKSNRRLHPCYLSFYKSLGFLPEAIKHYLLSTMLPPQSHVRVKRDFSAYELTSMISFKDCARHPERFDINRVLNLQKVYMQRMSIDDLALFINKFLLQAKMSNYWSAIDKGCKIPESLLSTAKLVQKQILFGGEIAIMPQANFSDGLLQHIGSASHLG